MVFRLGLRVFVSLVGVGLYYVRREGWGPIFSTVRHVLRLFLAGLFNGVYGRHLRVPGRGGQGQLSMFQGGARPGGVPILSCRPRTTSKRVPIYGR